MDEHLVRMNTVAAGPDFAAQPGELKLVDTARRDDFVDGGYAEPAEVVLDREALEAALAADAAPPARKRQRAAKGPAEIR
jgi:hypothetical protein